MRRSAKQCNFWVCNKNNKAVFDLDRAVVLSIKTKPWSKVLCLTLLETQLGSSFNLCSLTDWLTEFLCVTSHRLNAAGQYGPLLWLVIAINLRSHVRYSWSNSLWYQRTTTCGISRHYSSSRQFSTWTLWKCKGLNLDTTTVIVHGTQQWIYIAATKWFGLGLHTVHQNGRQVA